MTHKIDKETRECVEKALKYLKGNRALWNGPQFQAVWTLQDLLGEPKTEIGTKEKDRSVATAPALDNKDR